MRRHTRITKSPFSEEWGEKDRIAIIQTAHRLIPAGDLHSPVTTFSIPAVNILYIKLLFNFYMNIIVEKNYAV